MYSKKPIKQVTLCFLIKNDEILLAMKKRGFGQGKWNGLGGKLLEGETPREAAIRETEEEISVTPIDLEQVATINFLWKEKPEWDQECHVYFATSWQGEPTEGEEMAPQWFKQTDLPFDEMWPDDPLWLPRVLVGEKLKADFYMTATGFSGHKIYVKS